MRIKDIFIKYKQGVLLIAIGLGVLLLSLAVYLAAGNRAADQAGVSGINQGNQPSSGEGSQDSSKPGQLSNHSSGTPQEEKKEGESVNQSSQEKVMNTIKYFKWPIPQGKAQAKVQMVNDNPRLFINDVQVPPIMFFGNTDMNARHNILAEEVKKAAEGNIHFYSVISSPTIGSKEADEIKYFDLTNDLDTIIDNDPNGYILLRVNVGKYYGTEGYPSSDIVKYVTQRSDHLKMASIASEKWLTDTKTMLTELVQYIRSHPVYSKHVVGYHLDCGEWFQYMFRENGSDISQANSKKFRSWLTRKYKTDAALKTAWSDKSVTLAEAKVPEDLPGNLSGKPEDRTLMLKSTDRRYIDYLDYIGDLVSDTIAELSKTIKAASNRENFVIAFYGYLFELADPQSGHFKLEKLLANSDIDGFSSPECYLDRNVGELFPKQPAGSTGAYMSPVDSVQRAGKMWFVESDQRTFINRANAATEHDSYLVPAQSVWEVEELAKRDIGSIMLRGAAIWFMDLWAVGWLDDPSIWHTNGKLADVYQSYAQSRKSMAKLDVAFVVDEPSQSLVAQPTDSAWHFLSYQRYDLYRAGVSFGMFSMKDLLNQKIGDAKVIFILNPFRLSTEQVDKIVQAAKGKTLVFSYGFGETSLDNIKKLTGMTINKADGKVSVKLASSTDAAKFGLSDDSSFGASVSADPMWYVADGSDLQIGKYSDGKIGFAAKDLGSHKAVFFGGMRMNTDVIRAIVKYSGGHIFTTSDDVSMANENLYILHSSDKGVKTISFPQKTDVYDYFKNEWYTNVNSIKISVEYGETRYFFYGKKSEIESMKLPQW